MEISIGSYKLRVEILVAIVVVFWVMFGHLLCSCCKVSLFEGVTTMSPGGSNIKKALRKAKKQEVDAAQIELDAAQAKLDKLKEELAQI